MFDAMFRFRRPRPGPTLPGPALAIRRAILTLDRDREVSPTRVGEVAFNPFDIAAANLRGARLSSLEAALKPWADEVRRAVPRFALLEIHPDSEVLAGRIATAEAPAPDFTYVSRTLEPDLHAFSELWTQRSEVELTFIYREHDFQLQAPKEIPDGAIATIREATTLRDWSPWFSRVFKAALTLRFPAPSAHQVAAAKRRRLDEGASS